MSFITLNSFQSNAWKLSKRDIVRSGLLLNLDANTGISGNTWLDSSPSQNHYTAYRADNWTNTWNSTPGIDANSISEDISINIVNSYQVVNLTGTNNQFLYSTQNMGTTLNAGFTYEVWCCPTLTGNMNVLLENKQDAVGNTGAGTFSSHIGLSANKITTGYDTVSVANNATYSTNVWYQIVEVFDGVTVHQYVNGVYNNRTVADRAAVTSQRLTIGLSNSNGLSSFTGYIGALNVYNRGLSSVEVAQNYNAFCTRYNRLTITSPVAVPVVTLNPFTLTTNKVDISLNYTTNILFNFIAVKRNNGTTNNNFVISNTNPTIYKDAGILSDLSYTYVLTPYNNNNIKGTALSRIIYVPPPKVATGGTITDSGGYRFHTFTTTGLSTFTIVSGINSIDAVIVAGGSNGGNPANSGNTNTWRSGNGGSGGGLIDIFNYAVNKGTYSINVGNAGTTSNAFNQTANINAGGGGAGGLIYFRYTTFKTAGNGGNGGYSLVTSTYYGGGGGGGGDGSTPEPGTGGYRGGGAGGRSATVGGNSSYNLVPASIGIAGTPNTGGGGGGGGYNGSMFFGTGGAGGSGIVVVRYTYP